MDVVSYLLGKQAGGGSTPTLQNKSVTITENGTINVTADAGYDGLSKVEVTTNVSGGGTTASPDFVTFRGYSGTSLDISWLRTENITDMGSMFRDCSNLRQLDLSKFVLSNGVRADYMFRASKKLAILDISSFDANKISSTNTMFYDCGVQCLQSDGAYANGIPYVYVKDATTQNWVLTADNGRPSTWTTDNVIIKQ